MSDHRSVGSTVWTNNLKPWSKVLGAVVDGAGACVCGELEEIVISGPTWPCKPMDLPSDASITHCLPVDCWLEDHEVSCLFLLEGIDVVEVLGHVMRQPSQAGVKRPGSPGVVERVHVYSLHGLIHGDG